MKKVAKLLHVMHTELGAALSPEQKKEICENAKALAQIVLNGVWLELALLVISGIEATIKMPSNA